MNRSSLAAILCVATLLSVASAQRLRSPWDSPPAAAPITPTDAPYACPVPPAFNTTLNVEGYYNDKQYSVIDPQKLAAFNAATAGPTHLGQYATAAADKWLSYGSRAAAVCVYALLAKAAAADAWDGHMPDDNGVYLQNWMLSGTAIAYLKVRNSHVAIPAQDAAIRRWFHRVGARVRDYFDMGRTRIGTDAWNNHMYWAGLALTAAGVAENNQEDFLWGLATYRMGIDAIQPDGSLTAEMGRAERALHYQLYALGPLVMIAELGEANGIPMYAQKDGALHRLVRFDIAAMQNPSIITKRAGIKQDVQQPYSGLEIGWAVPYVRRFPNFQLSAWIAQAPWVNFWQWGGAPPDIPAPSPPPPPAEAAFLRQLREHIQQTLDADFDPAPFFGAWCAEDDPVLRSTIVRKEDSILLTTQTGSTSAGQPTGQQALLAPAWDAVIGFLTPDHTQIDWTNGTYWTRCSAHSPRNRPLLTGSWIAMGDRSHPASIRQHGDNLQLDNGRSATATGHIDPAGAIRSDWSGNPITGQLTPDGNHINWDNQTYWTRAKIYQAPKN